MPKPTYEELELKVRELETQIEASGQKEVKRHEQAGKILAESEKKYEALFESMAQGVFYQRSDGVLLDCNAAVLDMLGLSRDQFMGRTSIDPEWRVIDENGADLPGNRHPSMVALKSGKPVYDFVAAVYNPRIKDYVWLNINAIPLFRGRERDPYQVFVTLHDITRLKRAEVALAESEKRFRILTDLSPGGIYLADKDGRCVYANKKWLKMAGMSLDEAKGDGWIKSIHPEDREQIRGSWNHLVSSQGKGHAEFRLCDRQGKVTWVYGLAVPIYGNDKSITGYMGVDVDIGERKQAEEDLRVSEQKNKDAYRFLQLIVDTIPVRLFWKDRDLRYLGCNQLFAQDAGVNCSEDLIGSDDYSLGWKEHAEQYRKDDLEVITTGRSKLNFEEPQTTPGGRCLTLLTSKVPIRDASNAVIGLLGTYEDITRRKRMENEILRTQKLESLGRLAGGIAHDFNNSLMGIIGNISLAMMECSPKSKLYERLANAEKACMNAKKISQQFLIFSKGGDPVRTSTFTADVIKANCQLALSGTKSTCKLSIPDDIWNIYADAGQIGQVLTNLLVNADQATPDGGAIKLYCENVVVGNDDELSLKPGRYVKVTIADQGTGIDKEIIDRVFDPYFTTKPSGTGLGLASSYTIVQKHEGYISVESTSGSGSILTFYIPASSFPAPPTKEDEPSVVKGKGRILIMDDNEMVLNAVGVMLQHLGYDVDFAEGGEKALASYEKAMQAGSPFDLVLMDLIVPSGMGGEEATQKLLSIDPDARVIVSSGYSNDPILAKYEDYGFCGVLKKPYRLNELSQILKLVFNDRMGDDSNLSS